MLSKSAAEAGSKSGNLRQSEGFFVSAAVHSQILAVMITEVVDKLGGEITKSSFNGSKGSCRKGGACVVCSKGGRGGDGDFALVDTETELKEKLDP